MKYSENEVRAAYQRLTKSIKYGDAYWSEKAMISDVLSDYFNRIESKKVVVDPKYESYRCPKCNTTLIGQYDHYCRQCGQKLDWRI
jgi:rubrerythrin|nr:MAG TPA: hydrogenase/urease nickel incorporation protein [Bacteriophage sp.]